MALLDYSVVRGSSPGPLFKFKDGCLLTCSRFEDAVRSHLTKAKIDSLKYNKSSKFAAVKGVEDSIIKTLARWESSVYFQYVWIPWMKLTGYFQSLVNLKGHGETRYIHPCIVLLIGICVVVILSM